MFLQTNAGTKVKITNSIYTVTGSIEKTRKSEIDGEYENYVLLGLEPEDGSGKITIEFWSPKFDLTDVDFSATR